MVRHESPQDKFVPLPSPACEITLEKDRHRFGAFSVQNTYGVAACNQMRGYCQQLSACC